MVCQCGVKHHLILRCLFGVDWTLLIVAALSLLFVLLRFVDILVLGEVFADTKPSGKQDNVIYCSKWTQRCV